MGRLSLRLALLAALCVLMHGCFVIDLFSSQDDTWDPGGTWTDGSWVPTGKPRIKPGVVLNVRVSATGISPVEMAAQVDQGGYLTLPYLLTEPVLCDSLTLDACQQKLLKAYLQYLRQPQVTVWFAPIDPKLGVSPYGTVKVLGEVVMPGPINMPPTMDLTVTKVLKEAGGTKQFADKHRVRVTRRLEDGTSKTIMVDLVEIGEKGRSDKDIVLKPGDVVYVHEVVW